MSCARGVRRSRCARVLLRVWMWTRMRRLMRAYIVVRTQKCARTHLLENVEFRSIQYCTDQTCAFLLDKVVCKCKMDFTCQGIRKEQVCVSCRQFPS